MHTLKQAVAELISPTAGLPADEVAAALSYPPDAAMGDLAFPCFPLAKIRKTAPPKIAAELATQLQPGGLVQEWIAAGPYLNVRLDPAGLAAAVLGEVQGDPENYGGSAQGAGQSVVVDYSSPNIGKAIAFHHLRSTMIGNALVRILRAHGYTVHGVNHLGDWGTQFGFLLNAFQDFGVEDIAKMSIGEIHAHYAAGNAKAKDDPSVREAARAAFAALEGGDESGRAKWEAIRDVSMAAFDHLYARLGVQFEAQTGESFYEDRLAPLIQELSGSGVAEESEGALVIDLEGDGIKSPLLLRKSDGATLYATRDLAAARYRQETYGFAKAFYVTDQGQGLHFKQLFAALKKMGHDWAGGMVHVPFGILLMWAEDPDLAEGGEWTRGKSRDGSVVLLEDVLDEAAARVRTVIEAKNPALAGTAQGAAIAEQIGVGAVIFNDLKNSRQKDVHFKFEDALNFEGDAGPYVQNAHVRTCAILRKSEVPVDPAADVSGLTHDAERELLLQLSRFPEAVQRALHDLEPHHIAGALLKTAGALHRFYHHCPVLKADSEALAAARLRLVDATRIVLARGLHLLGVAAPEEM
ncbi:MAG: arginine--tRNA ligase [Planctomycetota bacterium]|jgi:arginyl-tRNA synthetase